MSFIDQGSFKRKKFRMTGGGGQKPAPKQTAQKQTTQTGGGQKQTANFTGGAAKKFQKARRVAKFKRRWGRGAGQKWGRGNAGQQWQGMTR